MNGFGLVAGEEIDTGFGVDNSNNIWKTAADVYASSVAARNSTKVELAKVSLAREIAAASRTQATPSGFLSQYQQSNPLPGMWTPFPQAQTKPEPGAAPSFIGVNPNLIFWGIVLVIGYFALWALLGKKRR